MESSKIKELAQDQQDYVVAMRREFHRSPELSGKEFHTRERLIEEIEKMENEGIICGYPTLINWDNH